ncbi:MAG: hypothetical protein ACREJT_02765, partial [Myxococcota bacterium]
MAAEPRSTGLVLFALAVALACANPPPPTAVPAAPRIRRELGDLGRLALVEVPPEGEFHPDQIYTPGTEVLRSTGRGVVVGSAVCAYLGLSFPQPAGVILGVLCLPAGVAIGGVTGLFASQPYMKQEDFERVTREGAAQVLVKPSLADSARGYAERSGRPLVDAATADSIVEIGLARIELLSAGGEDAYLRVAYRAKLIRVSDGATLDEYAAEAATRAQPTSWWLATEAVHLQEALVALQTDIAERAFDELVLVYAGERRLVDPPTPQLLQ